MLACSNQLTMPAKSAQSFVKGFVCISAESGAAGLADAKLACAALLLRFVKLSAIAASSARQRPPTVTNIYERGRSTVLRCPFRAAP
jgi:hypothetical protein